MSIFELAALLLTLAALFGWINHQLLHLPHSIGLLMLGLATSLLLAAARFAFPQVPLYDDLAANLRHIDFTQLLINGMLAFLLFAGALNVDFEVLRRRAGPVLYLAIVGTVISTAIIGVAIWGVAGLIGINLALPWALVFGALISPTDPVAVLTMLKGVDLPRVLRVEAEGEALFNDGIGLVLFTLLIGIAVGTETPNIGGIAWDLVREAGGGVLLGVIAGYLAYRAMRAIDDYPVEVLITLALVTGSYAVATRIGVSGPLATVAAGLLVGNRAPKDAMSDRTQTYVSALWTLIDEVLNSVLFLLIGLEVLVLDPKPEHYLLAAAAVPISLLARWAAVGIPLLLPLRGHLNARYVPFLTWAGVRGGISVALALSLPASDARSAILAATYAVVIFSIVVQGLTLKPLIRRLALPADGPPEPGPVTSG